LTRIGPADIYPDSARTPGFANPDITQANIADNLCSPTWSTSSIRPPTSYYPFRKRAPMIEEPPLGTAETQLPPLSVKTLSETGPVNISRPPRRKPRVK